MDTATALSDTREVKRLIDLAFEHLEVARRCEQAAGYLAVSGRWVDHFAQEKTRILEAERNRHYELAGKAIDAIGLLATAR